MWCGFGDLREQSSVRKKKRIIRIVPKLEKTIKDSNVLESFNKKDSTEIRKNNKRFRRIRNLLITRQTTVASNC